MAAEKTPQKNPVTSIPAVLSHTLLSSPFLHSSSQCSVVSSPPIPVRKFVTFELLLNRMLVLQPF